MTEQQDSETGIRPISKWGSACGRGFISNARFGSGTVIKRTNRETSRKWRSISRTVNSASPEDTKPKEEAE